MPQQTVTVNGHAYTLEPVESGLTNCDYFITAVPPGGTSPVWVGMLEWVGNGETNFDYKVTDYLGQYAGTFSNFTDAITAIDTELYA